MADSQGKSTAKRLMKRATKLVEALQAAGADISDLHARLAISKDEFGAGRYHEAEMLAEEVVVIANALRHHGGSGRPARAAIEPSPHLMRAVGGKIRKALQALVDGRKLETRVRRVAREVVERAVERERTRAQRTASQLVREESRQACEELSTRIDIEGRLGGLLAGRELGERIAGQIAEALSALPDEQRVRALCDEVGRRALFSEELAAVIKETTDRELEAHAPPSREEIEAIALERIARELGAKDVASAVRETAQAVAEESIAACGYLTPGDVSDRAGDVAAEVFRRLLDAPETRQQFSGLAGSVAREVVENVPRLSAAEAEEIAAAAVSAGFEKYFGPAFRSSLEGEAFGSRVEELARGAASGVFDSRVPAALNGLPDEERVRQLASEAVAQSLHQDPPPTWQEIENCAISRVRAELGGARINEAIAAIARGEAHAVLAERECVTADQARQVAREIVGSAGPSSEEIREIATRAASEELSAMAIPDAGTVRQLATELIEEKLAVALSGALDEERVGELAATIAAGKISEVVAGIPDEQRVRAVAGEVAGRVVAEASTGALDEERARTLAAEVTEERVSAVVADLPNEDRVRELAAAAAGEKALDDEAVRNIALAAVDKQLSDMRAGIPGEERIREIAAGVAVERVAEALGALPDEERIRSLACEVVERRMEEAAAETLDESQVRALAAEVYGQQGPDADAVREIAGAVAAERVAGLASEERVGELLSEKVDGLIGEEQVRELLARQVDGLAGEDRVRALAAEVCGQQALDADAVREIAAAVAAEGVAGLAREERVGELLSEKVDGLIGEERVRELIAQQVAGLAGEGRVRALAAEVYAQQGPDADAVREIAEAVAAERFAGLASEERVAELLSERVDGLIGEERVRELIAQQVAGSLDAMDFSAVVRSAAEDAVEKALSAGGLVTSEVLAERLREATSGLDRSAELEALRTEMRTLREAAPETESGVDEAQVRALVGDEVGKAVAERLNTALESYTSSEALSARIAEIARSAAGPVDEKIAAHVDELVEEAVADRVRAAVEVHLAGDGIAAQMQTAVSTALGERLGQALEAYTSSEALAARIDELIGDSVTNAVGEQLASEEFETRFRALGRGAAGEAVSGAVSDEDAERLRKLEGSLEALPAYLQGTARIYQRLNGLEKSLERMPQSEHVEEEISELRKQVASTAEKISDMPGPQTVREMAESALTDTLEHIDRLEAEHSEGRAGEHLRELIRREVASAAPGGGKVDHEEIAKVLGALMGTPQFSEKLKKLLPAQEAPAAGAVDAAALQEEVEKQVEKGIADMLSSGELKAALGSLVSKGIKTVQHQEQTSTRMLRLKDVQAATDPQNVQSAVPQDQVDELLQQIVSSDDFKVAIDDRFRTMLDYIKADIIPKQVKKHMETQGDG